jgi:hypothetical protein
MQRSGGECQDPLGVRYARAEEKEERIGVTACRRSLRPRPLNAAHSYAKTPIR